MAEFTSMRNNALPYPVYGLPFVVAFPLLDADGDPISPSSPDSEISKNGDTFADCTNEAVEIATTSGICYLSLTGTELTTDVATVQVKSTGAKTTVLTLYPRKLVSIRAGTSASGGVSTSTIVLDGSASAVDDFYNGMIVAAVIDSVTEVRMITDYTGSNQTATVTPDWNTAPDNNDTFTVYRPDGVQIQQSNITQIAGATVSTSTAQLGVNVVNFGGSAGTFASGRPEVNTSHVGGTIQTAGDIIADTNDIQTRLPSSLSAGRMRSDVEAVGTSTAAVTNMVIVWATDFANNYNTTLDTWNVNVTQVAGTAAQAASGRFQVDVELWNGSAVVAPATAGVPTVELSAGELRKLTGFKAVTWIDTTDNAETIIEAAASGTLCILGPGTHTFTGDEAVVIPAGVTIRGCGSAATVLNFSDWQAGTIGLRPGGANVRIEDLTASCMAVNGFVFGAASTSAAFDCVVENCVFLGNDEIIELSTSNACNLTLKNVWLQSVNEWGLNISSAAHEVHMEHVTICVTANASPTDYKGWGISGTAKLFGDDVRILLTETANAGEAFRVQDTAQVHLSNSDLTRLPINVEDVGVYVMLTDCEFNRSAVTGQTARLQDNFSPLRPTTAFRTIGINASGHVDRVTLTDTVTTYTGNTPQTGDSYAIVNSGTHGNAALKTLIDAVDNFVDTEIAAIVAAIGSPTTLGSGANLAANLQDIAQDSGGGPYNRDTMSLEVIAGSAGATPAQIADAVWDEATSGHTTAGSTGKALTDAGSAGNPWSALVADNNDAGSFGLLVGSGTDPAWVDDDHTWEFDSRNQTTASNTIAEGIGFNALVALEPDLSPRVAILTASSASVTPATGGAVVAPTLGSPTVQTNKQRINLPIDATLATAGTFTVSITFTTTDGQIFVRKGRITFS